MYSSVTLICFMILYWVLARVIRPLREMDAPRDPDLVVRYDSDDGRPITKGKAHADFWFVATALGAVALIVLVAELFGFRETLFDNLKSEMSEFF